MAVIEAEKLTDAERTALVEEISADIEKADSAELIEVTQLPIIKEQLFSIKEQFEQEAQDARALACTEETLKDVRERRARITKVFNVLEEKRKQAKKAILAPYEAFEEIYKACVTDIYKPCDKELADKIHEVEDSLKHQKRDYALDYFDECCRNANIDFLTIDRVGLSIGLSTSKKAIRDKISEFVAKVSEELVLIDTQENSAEILVEYKQSLNAAQAIMLVTHRHRAMAVEQARLEAKRVRDEERAAAVEKVEEAAAEMQAPTAETIPETEPTMPVESPEEEYELSFTVRGTMAQLKALKAFLNDNGYDVRNGGGENG